MRIRLAVPDEVLAACGGEILEPALETVTRANEALIRAGKCPTAIEQIRHGLRWRPEPPWGHEAFDIGTTTMRRGWADCDDLGPLAAASDRVTGRDPQARAVVRQSAPGRFHCVIQHADGSIEDPSRTAGMPARDRGARPSLTRPIHDTTAIGWMPMCVGGQYGYVCRADLPWLGTPFQVAGSTWAPNPVDAATLAVRAHQVLAETGGRIPPDELRKLAALEALLRGINPNDVQKALHNSVQNPAVLGGFFDFIKDAISFIPGVGPIVNTAIDAGGAIIDAVTGATKSDTPAPAAAPVPTAAAAPNQGQGLSSGSGVQTYGSPGQPSAIIVRF